MSANCTDYEKEDILNIVIDTQVPKECVKFNWCLGQDFVVCCPRGAEEFEEQLSQEFSVGADIEKACTLIFSVTGQNKYLSFQLKLLNIQPVKLPRSYRRNDYSITGSMLVMLKDAKGELLAVSRLPKFELDCIDSNQCGWSEFIKIEDLWGDRTEGSEGQLLFNILIYINGDPMSSMQTEVTTDDDLTLLCDDQLFKVHRSALCEASGYFRRKFGPGTRESCQKPVTLPDYVDASTAGTMLDFIYTGSLDEEIGMDLAVKLLNVAKVYDIKSLAEKTLLALCENVRIKNYEQIVGLCEQCEEVPPEAEEALDKFYKKNSVKLAEARRAED